jgi:dTDP-4-amino-4,6-dideoxygalactose transaminase
LAINGGRAAVIEGQYPLWGRLKRAGQLALDVVAIAPTIAVARKTTITDGSGIIEKFEKEFARFTGSSLALAMTNGTATLHSAYFALGVGPGTEVIVPSYTWHASASPILLCGATPVFCEIDPRTLTLDPDDVERRLTPRTRAICAVHIWGNPAEMDRIIEIAKRHGVGVVEDCSHAHGSVYRGKSVGKWGDIGCFSLNSSKPVDGGEAGIAVTDDPVLFDHMLQLGHFGRIAGGQAARTFNLGDMGLGLKYRPHMCAIHLAAASMKRLADRNEREARVWQWLCDELGDADGLRPISTLPDAFRASYYGFVFAYERGSNGGPSREEFLAAARAEGVPIDVDRYSVMPGTGKMLHQTPLFTEFDRRTLGGCFYDPTRPWEEICRRVSMPVTERLGQQLVSLSYSLYESKESYVRSCGKALRKVLKALK